MPGTHHNVRHCAFAEIGWRRLGINLRYRSARLTKSQAGLPMALGNAAAAHVRPIVWCEACGHQLEPDPAEMAR